MCLNSLPHWEGQGPTAECGLFFLCGKNSVAEVPVIVNNHQRGRRGQEVEAKRTEDDDREAGVDETMLVMGRPSKNS